MNKKTIKVDLSLFFEDERKMSYIFMDPAWKTVECLQKRLELLFDISSVWLLSDGCFLPSKESIEIVRCCDVIKAFIPKESLKIKKNRKSKKPKETLEESKSKDFLSEESIKQKDVFEELVTSTHVSIVEPSILSGVPNLPDESNKELKKSSSKNSSNLSKKQKLANEEVITKTRFSKIASSTLLNESDLIKQNSSIPQQLSKSENLNNPFKKRKSSKAHIYFNESGDISSPKSRKEKNSLPKTVKEPGTIVVFRCSLNEIANSNSDRPLKPRIFHLKPKQKIEIQEDILIPTPQSIQNATNESSLSNEVTLINKVSAHANETEGYDINLLFNNSTIGLTVEKEQAGIKNLNDYQNEKTNINETENESNASTQNKADLTSVDESICKMQNKSQKVVGVCFDADTRTFDIKNKSQLELTCVEKSDVVTEQASEIKDENDINQTLNHETNIMPVYCIDLEEEDDVLKDDTQDENDLNADDGIKNSSASDVEEVSEIIDLNESGYNCSTTLNNQIEQTNSPKKIKAHEILPYSFDITNLPEIEDIIVFKVKMPTLFSNKTRVDTNFLAGKVEYVNKRSNTMKILILDGVSELCHVPSHFVCSLKDSNESIKYLQLKFSDLVEPKLFSMS